MGKKKKAQKFKYRFKREPYNHQVAAIRSTIEGFRKRGSHALLMEPRTGKTKVSIDTAAMLYGMGRCNRVLVTCPLTVTGVWRDEIRANCPVPFQIVIWDKRGRKRTSLPPWGVKRLVFVIVNDDAFSVPGARKRSRKTGELTDQRSHTRGGRYTLVRLLKDWQPQLIILDEMHRYKSVTGAKHRSMKSLAPTADFRLGLTGTPITKKKRVFDVYAQWQLLNPESPLVAEHTKKTFTQEYSVMTERNGYPQWLRERNTAKLQRLMHDESFAVKRDECFDLPPRTNQIIPVELSGHTAEVYDRMAEDMVAKIKTGELTEASIKLVLGLRLAQITGGYTKTMPTDEYPEGRLVRLGRDKLNVLEGRLYDLFEAEEKVVVGARFRPDLAAIAALGKKLKVPVFELHGGVDNDTRWENIRQFTKLQGPALFSMQPTAGSLGIDLSAASIFIWFSLPGGAWVPFSQSEDRVALSPRPTFFEYLLVESSVDEVFYDTLTEDGNFADAITQSPERLLRNFKVREQDS